jgi:hypothetical protein
MRRRVNQITDAVKAVVPESMWGAIADKVDELEHQHDALDVETDDYDDDDAPTVPPSSSPRTRMTSSDTWR